MASGPSGVRMCRGCVIPNMKKGDEGHRRIKIALTSFCSGRKEALMKKKFPILSILAMAALANPNWRLHALDYCAGFHSLVRSRDTRRAIVCRRHSQISGCLRDHAAKGDLR